MELLTIDQAAAFLGLKTSTLYSWVESRPPRVPFVKLGPRAIRFVRSDLEEWIQAQRESAEVGS